MELDFQYGIRLHLGVDLRYRCLLYIGNAQCFASQPMTALHRKHRLDKLIPMNVLNDGLLHRATCTLRVFAVLALI